MSFNNVVTPPQASAGPPETEVPLLQSILAALGGTSGSGPTNVIVGGFVIPAYDKIDLAYYGDTNNLKTQKFSKNGATVATLTYAYAAGGAADDDLLTVIQQS